MDSTTHPYFVPYTTEGTRNETAILLVGTAKEYDIPQREIASCPTAGGYFISQRLFDVLYTEDEQEDTTEPSGNRAEKNDSQKGN